MDPKANPPQEFKNGGPDLYEWFSHRANRDLACHAECVECGEMLSSRLLWPVHATQEGESMTALLCFGCVAVELLRMFSGSSEENRAAVTESAVPVTETETETGTAKRCDRCQRRSRPTTQHVGFNLCGECRGEAC